LEASDDFSEFSEDLHANIKTKPNVAVISGCLRTSLGAGDLHLTSSLPADKRQRDTGDGNQEPVH
jgi:hypothetical protein